jgi:ATP/ADP translocase
MIRRLVDIRPGELRPLVLSGGVLALTIAAHTVTETARDALFLSKLPPERLTVVYALLAVVSLIAAAASAWLAARFGRRAALVFSLQACAYGAVILYLRPPTALTVFVLYVGSGVVITVLTLQFWMLAGEIFSVAQGKRLFGPITAGGVLGAAVGGAIAAVALRFVHTGGLLLVAAALFIVAALLAAGAPTGGAAERTTATPTVIGWTRGLSSLRGERYVTLVAGLTAFGTATVLVADYLFKLSAAALYPERLGSFFALFYAGQNALALAVQLFAAGPLVRRLGVTGALLVLPLVLAVSGTGAALGGGFAIALAAKGADGSLRHSLHRVSSELLLLPLAQQLRERAKPIIDTVFARGTQAAIAGLILVVSMLGLGQPRVLGALMGLFAAAWLVTALAIRRPYVDLFRRALARGDMPGSDATDLDLASVELLMEALASRDEDRVMAAIDVLDESGRARLLPALILYHDSPRILERGLEVLATPDRRDWLALAERLIDHAEASVRAAAVKALAAVGNERALERGSSDRDEAVRASAIFFLARRAGGDVRSEPHVAELLAREDYDARAARCALLELIGDYGDPTWLAVVEAVVARDGGERGVAASAAAAIQRTGDGRFAAYLVSQLGAREGRAMVRDGIVALGDAGWDELVRALDDPTTSERLRLEIPKTLAAYLRQETVDYLTARLASEASGAVRFRMLRALGRMSTRARAASSRLTFDRERFEGEARRNLVEHFRLKALVLALDRASDDRSAGGTAIGRVLHALLRDKVDQSLERAFRALQLAHRNEDLAGVHKAVVGGDPGARGNALELLDALPLATRGLKELLLLTADELAEEDAVRRAQLVTTPGASDPVVDHDAAVRRLLVEPDDLVAALAAYHAFDLGSIVLAKEALAELDQRPALGALGAAPTKRGESLHG